MTLQPGQASRSTYVRVTNGLEDPITDKCDGVTYVFEPGKPLTIPGSAARHIFGWNGFADGKINETYLRKRWGWNGPGSDGMAGDAMNRIVLQPVMMAEVEIPMTVPEDQIPIKGGQKIPVIDLPLVVPPLPEGEDVDTQ